MEHSRLVSEARSVEECIADIKLNKTQGMKWYAARAKNGCLFELGGTNIDGLWLKAYIPFYDEDGIPLKYPKNEMVWHSYSFDHGGFYLSNANAHQPVNVMELIKTKDFRTWKLDIKYYTVSTQTITAAKVTNL